MADRIKGITIEINGDTTPLQTALKDVNKHLKNTETELKDVNKLLKFDPKNTDLLRQKQKLLNDAIGDCKTKLETLKQAQSQYAEGSKEWNAIEREIVDVQHELESLEKQYKDFGSVAKQKIQAVGREMEAFGQKIQNVGSKLQPISTAAAGIGAGLVGLGYKAVTTADDLNTLSKQTGFTTEEIQKLQYASDLVDVSFESITGALTKLKPKISADNKELQALGVSVTNADGSLRNATDVFYDAVEAIGGIANETERDQIAMSLFGKGANELAGILDDGGAALKEYGQQAEDLGLILEQDTLDNLNQINDAIDTAKAQGGAALAQLGATIAQVLLPVIEKLVPVIQDISLKMANMSPETAEMILKIVTITAVAAPLISTIGKIVSGIGSLMTILPMLISPVGAIVAAIAGVIAILVHLWNTNEEFRENVKAIWEKVKEIFSAAVEHIKQVFASLKENFAGVWESIKTVFTGIIQFISGVFTGDWKKAWEGIKTIFTGVLTGIFESAKAIFNNVWNHIKGIVDKLKGVFNFEWKLPHIKLPHISISKKKGLFGLEYPSFSVSWYKKAYENPYLFTSPTVVNGRGFGDGGGSGEIVYGRDQLMRDIAMASQGEVTINVYANEGMNVNQLADKISQRLAQVQKQRLSAYA